MKLRFNTWLPVASFLALSVSLAAYNDKDDAHAKSAPPKLQSDLPQREVTPSAGPRVNNGWDVFISADFIYWSPRIDGLGYELTGFGNGTATPKKGSVHHPNWSWEPGFKVGLGFGLGTDGWDLQGQYVWIRSKDTESKGISTAGQYPMWNIANQYNNPQFNSSGEAPVKAAKCRWDFYWNEIDANLGRNMYLSQYFATRPFVGLKATWTGTSYNLSYTRPADTDNDSQIDVRDRLNIEQKQWGIGVEAGFNNAWHFTKEFSLYSDFCLTGLYGNYNVHRVDTRTQVPEGSNTTFTIFNFKNNVYTLKPLLEMAIGLRYETWFADDEYHFLIQAGWEEVFLYDYNQLTKLTEESNHGDLSMQGLTVKVRFDF
ncbi:MAG: hypothetical protein SP1CHLAM54_13150 [Chlamydiia bacterium]|nr:hypothetical protein [Chlamydiia bacterium]MCH9616211.1 hypothetical protein [Chlamydiia bacterium]MCH9629803.1 hypothetical protein [Chlamydiia bacterium]